MDPGFRRDDNQMSIGPVPINASGCRYSAASRFAAPAPRAACWSIAFWIAALALPVKST
jgi:hypothetical protein